MQMLDAAIAFRSTTTIDESRMYKYFDSTLQIVTDSYTLG